MRNCATSQRATRNPCANVAPSNSRNHRVPLQSVSVGTSAATNGDREIIRCVLCGLVQYRTKNNFCRKCLHLLPCTLVFRTLTPAPPVVEETAPPSTYNHKIVNRIGERIRELRESRGMTQSQLQNRSRVSRSYLSRIESGQMTPSLGTLEKISEALQVAFHRFLLRKPVASCSSRTVSFKVFGPSLTSSRVNSGNLFASA
jgi:DNA-binding XRE family transcriptional regulator